LGGKGPDPAGLDAQVMLGDLQAQMFGAHKPTWSDASHCRSCSDVARLGPSTSSLGNVYQRWERYAQAEETFVRSLHIIEKALGPDHANVASMVNNLASLALRDGRHAEADTLFTRAITIRERALGVDHPRLLNSLSGRSQARIALGRAAEAVIDAERAMKLAEATDGDPVDLADARLDVARALVASEGDLGRARELADQAVEAIRAAGERYAEDVEKAEAWIRKLPSGGA